MNSVDLVVIIVAILAALRGVLKGFIREVTGLGMIGLGVFFSVLFARPLQTFFDKSFGVSDLNIVLSFAAIFAVVLVVMLALRHTLIGIVEGLHVGVIDRAAGFAFGLVEGLALCALVLFVLHAQSVWDVRGTIEASRSWNAMSPLLPLLNQALDAGMKVGA